MSKDFKSQLTVRALVVYLAAVAVAWILTEVVWGATSGLVGGLTMARSPEYQQQITLLLKDKEIGPKASRSEARQVYQNLSKREKQKLMELNKKALADIDWFLVTLFVSAVVFGLVGCLGGVIARAWLLAGIVPTLSFLINNPVIRFQMAKDLSTFQKTVVVVFAQFAICYFLAYWGTRLSLKQKQKCMVQKLDVEK